MECVFDRNFHFLNKTDCGDDSEISGREKQSRNLRCAPSDVGGNVWSPDVEGKRDIYTVFGNGHQIHDLSQKERYKGERNIGVIHFASYDLAVVSKCNLISLQQCCLPLLKLLVGDF